MYNTTTDTNMLREFGGINENSLINILNADNTIDNEPIIMKHSSYFEEQGVINELGGKTHNFTIISLNCQSIFAKIEEIRILLHKYDAEGVPISVLCLQETWLKEEIDLSLLHIEGYQLLAQGKICCGHGGLIMYIKNCYKYTMLPVYTHSDMWEGVFIEITNIGKNKHIIIGNIYRPPKTLIDNYRTFINEITQILVGLQTKKQNILLAGDFNVDLLQIKYKPIFSEYLDTLISNGFFPCITLPTRIANRSCTLIDNILCNLSTLTTEFTSGIIISRISDHFPIFMSLFIDEHTDIKRKTIHVRMENRESINEFKNDIRIQNIYDKLDKNLNTDPNNNYNMLEQMLTLTSSKYFKTKIVTFNKHKHKKSKWITNGIIRSIRYRDKLHMNLIKIPFESEQYYTHKINLQTYNRIL